MWFPWLNSRKTFSHGIHPPECKEATRGKPIRRLPFAPRIIIPLSQHTGAPAKPIVREDQEVVRGEPIAEPGGFVSVPMHAPVTGVVEKIGLARDVRGGMSPAIIIRQYQAANQEVLYGAETDIESLTPEELVKAVQATGVVGLGGAAFPTHVKLSLPEGKAVDTVIVNGCECEPFLTTDHRVMLEQVDSIYKGVRIVMRALGAKRAIVGIETNKMDAVATMRAGIPKGMPYTVEAIKAKYPQGAEKMLTKALLKREVPSGGLPIDIGVAVFNVATLAQIGELLPRRQGLIERVVTVSGTGVTNPGNFLMAIGTPLQFILDHVGFREKECEVILGGPMMGTTVASLDVPVTKGVTGILAIAKDHPLSRSNGRTFPCIRCGSCIDACPMHLNPSQLGLLARKREYDVMAEEFHLMDCFECGCCSFVCPSNIPLVQYFRIAKAVTRERKVPS